MKVINDNTPSHPGNEASLDVQYITGMGTAIDTAFMHFACTTVSFGVEGLVGFGV